MSLIHKNARAFDKTALVKGDRVPGGGTITQVVRELGGNAYYVTWDGQSWEEGPYTLDEIKTARKTQYSSSLMRRAGIDGPFVVVNTDTEDILAGPFGTVDEAEAEMMSIGRGFDAFEVPLAIAVDDDKWRRLSRKANSLSNPFDFQSILPEPTDDDLAPLVGKTFEFTFTDSDRRDYYTIDSIDDGFVNVKGGDFNGTVGIPFWRIKALDDYGGFDHTYNRKIAEALDWNIDDDNEGTKIFSAMSSNFHTLEVYELLNDGQWVYAIDGVESAIGYGFGDQGVFASSYEAKRAAENAVDQLGSTAFRRKAGFEPTHKILLGDFQEWLAGTMGPDSPMSQWVVVEKLGPTQYMSENGTSIPNDAMVLEEVELEIDPNTPWWAMSKKADLGAEMFQIKRSIHDIIMEARPDAKLVENPATGGNGYLIDGEIYTPGEADEKFAGGQWKQTGGWMAKRKTSRKERVIPEPFGLSSRWQAQYYDEEVQVWFDIGDPQDTEEAARERLTSEGSRNPVGRPVIVKDGPDAGLTGLVSRKGRGGWYVEIEGYEAGPYKVSSLKIAWAEFQEYPCNYCGEVTVWRHMREGSLDAYCTQCEKVAFVDDGFTTMPPEWKTSAKKQAIFQQDERVIITVDGEEFEGIVYYDDGGPTIEVADPEDDDDYMLGAPAIVDRSQVRSAKRKTAGETMGDGSSYVSAATMDDNTRHHHDFQGQRLTHGHQDGMYSHGYYEHPEDFQAYSKKATLNTGDIYNALRDERHKGFGYGVGGRLPASVEAEADDMIIQVANELGLDFEDLFLFLDSKPARWMRESLEDKMPVNKSETEAIIRKFLNQSEIDSLRSEVFGEFGQSMSEFDAFAKKASDSVTFDLRGPDYDLPGWIEQARTFQPGERVMTQFGPGTVLEDGEHPSQKRDNGNLRVQLDTDQWGNPSEKVVIFRPHRVERVSKKAMHGRIWQGFDASGAEFTFIVEQTEWGYASFISTGGGQRRLEGGTEGPFGDFPSSAEARAAAQQVIDNHNLTPTHDWYDTL
jgi:hypothetical protein